MRAAPLLAFSIAVAATLPLHVSSEDGEAAPQSTRETPLGKLQLNLVADTFRLSPDNRRIAFAVQKEKAAAVVLDGVEGKSYPFIGVGCVEFSPDSKRLAYVAGTGSEGLLVVDGIEATLRHHNIGRSSVLFSPDSRHLVYGADQGQGRFAVVRDGVEGPNYENVDPISFVFSPDSQRFAYVARSKGKSIMIVDGVSGTPYDKVSGFVFSPDSAHSCYVAQLGKKCFLVKDGVPSDIFYDEIEISIFIVPASVRAQLDALLKEGRRHLGFQRSRGLLYSPDSKRFAFHAKRNGKWYCVLDGVEGPAFDEMEHWPCFSPDSKRYADTGVRGKKSIMIVDGVESEYAGIVPFSLNFSPDSSRVAFAASKNSEQFLVVDGAPQRGRYPSIGWTMVVFSPDSMRIAFGAQRKGKMFIVVDGIEGTPCDEIKPGLSFSSDGKHLAYRAGRNKKQFVVIDGKEGKEYDIVWAEGPLIQSNQTVAYLAVQASDATIYRVETDLVH